MPARGATPARRRGPVRAPARPALARWGKVGGLVALVVIGIPVAHALAGEVVALLGAAVLFGFLLGRWTARR